MQTFLCQTFLCQERPPSCNAHSRDANVTISVPWNIQICFRPLAPGKRTRKAKAKAFELSDTIYALTRLRYLHVFVPLWEAADKRVIDVESYVFNLMRMLYEHADLSMLA